MPSVRSVGGVQVQVSVSAVAAAENISNRLIRAALIGISEVLLGVAAVRVGVVVVCEVFLVDIPHVMRVAL